MTWKTIKTWLLRSMEPGMRYTAHMLMDRGEPWDDEERPEIDPDDDNSPLTENTIKAALDDLVEKGLVERTARVAHRMQYELTAQGADEHARLGREDVDQEALALEAADAG